MNAFEEQIAAVNSALVTMVRSVDTNQLVLDQMPDLLVVHNWAKHAIARIHLAAGLYASVVIAENRRRLTEGQLK